MTMQHWLKPIAGLAMVGALALAGCETQPRGGGSDDLNTRWNSDAWVDNSARTQQPAPSPLRPRPRRKSPVESSAVVVPTRRRSPRA